VSGDAFEFKMQLMNLLTELEEVYAAICELSTKSDNRMIYITTIVTTTFAYAALLTRFVVRWWLNQHYGVDDIIIMLAAVGTTLSRGYL
jgi:hypothetical protein